MVKISASTNNLLRFLRNTFGAGYRWLQGAKKRPDKGQEVNALVDNVVKEVINKNKHANDMAVHDLVSEEDQENFDLLTLRVGKE